MAGNVREFTDNLEEQGEEQGHRPVKKGWFHLKDLTAFKILKTEKISDSCVDIILKISYLYYISNLKEIKIKARVICETGPYKPSPTGKWGINPLSILREF